MATARTASGAAIAERLVVRNAVSSRYFDREAERAALICRDMADRFLRGGRLLAFGQRTCATDAQHIAVEFVHPVIAGKQALPALDLSLAFADWVPAMAGGTDIAVGFAPPEGDPLVTQALDEAERRGALTLALPGSDGTGGFSAPSSDPFFAQELIEILHHTLWETVHVFLEHHQQRDHEPGAGFLHPFMGQAPQDTAHLVREVATSIRAKAAEVERLRHEVARTHADYIARTASAVRERLDAGASLLLFGNGGSGTDANDWAIDCRTGPQSARISAISLASEPAVLTALANDIGREAVFLRQLAAHARQGDVAIAISTSGGSESVIAGLEEARKRNMLTVALLGCDGGEVVRRGLADLPIVVPCDYVPRIQEVQASIYHVMTEAWKQLPFDPAIRHPS